MAAAITQAIRSRVGQEGAAVLAVRVGGDGRVAWSATKLLFLSRTPPVVFFDLGNTGICFITENSDDDTQHQT